MASFAASAAEALTPTKPAGADVDPSPEAPPPSLERLSMEIDKLRRGLCTTQQPGKPDTCVGSAEASEAATAAAPAAAPTSTPSSSAKKSTSRQKEGSRVRKSSIGGKVPWNGDTVLSPKGSRAEAGGGEEEEDARTLKNRAHIDAAKLRKSELKKAAEDERASEQEMLALSSSAMKKRKEVAKEDAALKRERASLLVKTKKMQAQQEALAQTETIEQNYKVWKEGQEARKEREDIKKRDRKEAFQPKREAAIDQRRERQKGEEVLKDDMKRNSVISKEEQQFRHMKMEQRKQDRKGIAAIKVETAREMRKARTSFEADERALVKAEYERETRHRKEEEEKKRAAKKAELETRRAEVMEARAEKELARKRGIEEQKQALEESTAEALARQQDLDRKIVQRKAECRAKALAKRGLVVQQQKAYM